MTSIAFHILGAVALAIYVVAFFLKKGHYSIVRAAVNLLFALMFGTLQAFAPMVIYLFSAFYSIVPVYTLSAKLKLSGKINVLIFQGIPAVTAITVGILAAKTQAMSPFGTVITFVFPALAILLNLVLGFVSASGKRWTLAPLVRSLVWIVYFIVAGIWVSIAYEIFNLVIYFMALKHTGNLPKIKLPAIQLPAFKRRERKTSYERTRPTRACAPKKESIPLGNNVMSFDADDKNASQNTFVPTVFKGQW